MTNGISGNFMCDGCGSLFSLDGKRVIPPRVAYCPYCGAGEDYITELPSVRQKKVPIHQAISIHLRSALARGKPCASK